MKRFSLILFTLMVISWPAAPLRAEVKITLLLDWFPNVDHLPIYIAKQRGFFSEKGLKVEIISPSETSDALKLSASGNVDIAVAYEPQTLVGASRGLGIKVIGRLVGHPLTTLLFLDGKGIERPSDLEGKRIGYTVPGMMDILTEAFTKINGIKEYTPVNVGFAIVQSLTAGKIDAIMGAYKNYETVELEQRGYKAKFFALEKWGIPDYDELVFISGSKAINGKARSLRAFSEAVGKAISETRAHPEKALKEYFKALPEAPKEMESEAFKRTLPLYAETQEHDSDAWQKFADFAFTYGLIEKEVDVEGILHDWGK